VLEFAVLFEKPGLKMLVSQELKQLGRPLPAHRSLEDLEPLRVQFLFGNSFKKIVSRCNDCLFAVLLQ